MTDFFLSPIFWLILFVILLAIELGTYNLTTIWFALSCVPLIFLSWIGLSWPLQMLVFIVLTAVFLIFTRPVVVKKLKQKTNPNDLAGKKATVIEAIAAGKRGRVTTINGVSWNARSDSRHDLPVGTDCIIVQVTGNTLFVRAET